MTISNIAEGPGGWQGLETMPQDGQSVLLYFPDYDAQHMGRCFLGNWSFDFPQGEGSLAQPSLWHPLPANPPRRRQAAPPPAPILTPEQHGMTLQGTVGVFPQDEVLQDWKEWNVT